MNVENLQKRITQHGFDGYIVANNDIFFSEYTLEEENQLLQISGFSGSAGIGVVFDNKIHLFTDGRYELQAKKQLPKGSKVYVMPQQRLSDWLKTHTDSGKKFAFDPWLFRYAQFSQLSSNNITPFSINLLEKPTRKLQSLFVHEQKFSGKPAQQKLSESKVYLTKKQLDYFVIEDCDSISWVLNLRSDYYEFSPMVSAKFVLSAKGKSYLFLTEDENSSDISRYLRELDVEIKNIKSFAEYLTKISSNEIALEASCSYFVKQCLPDSKVTNSSIIFAKAIKNDIEIQGSINAHKRDAKALNDFYKWFEGKYKEEKFYTEYELANKLTEFRASQESYYSLSFPAIIGFRENGAVIHYRPSQNDSNLVTGDGLLLIDSGGQYFDGTTDVTRTYCLGEPTNEQKVRYTQVLKGHIAVASAKFDAGTTGADLDKLARKFLVEEGLNYAHGTGHGVGSFLNVHEGPYNIGGLSKLSLVENLILSIEPGFYKANEYGIRIENLYYTARYSDAKLQFIPLTLVPFENKLIDYEMLTSPEKEWLEYYNNLINYESSQ